ncbi:3-hydroxy-3-methylglutaryl-coenzyme A reductase 1-like [Silene latifolia]|uniref:3-hydroxy-3-methylglutaryl-coenzyme A reductase 1-like n=1 Tax=Silene latifolia TaxID=37657 RepID=UPI003D785B86
MENGRHERPSMSTAINGDEYYKTYNKTVPKQSNHSLLSTFLTYLRNKLLSVTMFFNLAYILFHDVTLSELLVIPVLTLVSFYGLFSRSTCDTNHNEEICNDVCDIYKECDRSNINEDDESVVQSVLEGVVSVRSLESRLKDCRRAVSVRREAVQRMTRRSLEKLPVEGFDYESIFKLNCESPVGYVQVPVGVAGPLLLNGSEFMVPLATTEGCVVATVNRGCKAIYGSGGATSYVLKDGMTRAPVVRFPCVERAVQLKFFLEDPLNFDTFDNCFIGSSKYARLQSIRCAIAGRNLYIRFCCSTGDAMGMNMVSKGVEAVLDSLKTDFPDMEVIGISGNFCTDKKAAAINWIDGRGKSVVCEAVIKEIILKQVLRTDAAKLVEVNMLKNLAGSAIAGALGGFNAHASNIVSAIFIATGQDPAQNIESSHCITMMEALNDGKDLHISVSMPSIEVGTVGGGTSLASQAACLNVLGVKGGSKQSPGENARRLATIVAASVLAGELSLMSAIATGDLVNSHMKYNRSSANVSELTC